MGNRAVMASSSVGSMNGAVICSLLGGGPQLDEADLVAQGGLEQIGQVLLIGEETAGVGSFGELSGENEVGVHDHADLISVHCSFVDDSSGKYPLGAKRPCRR